MAIRTRKPTSPAAASRRSSTSIEITKSTPEKSLLATKSKTVGRNTYGRKTSRHRGGGHKQRYRIVDFKRTKDGVFAKVAASSTTRTAPAGRACCTTTTAIRPILAPKGITSATGSKRPWRRLKPATRCPLRFIPSAPPPNVELRPGQGGKIGRSAGIAVQLVAKEGEYATLRMPSTEMRRVPIDCRATVGEVGNSEHELVKIGKAGRNRWKGVKPQTRGVAMNPVDHPMGGGEGRTSGGRPATSPWGKVESRTRRKKKASSKLIVRRRRTGKGRR